MGELLALPPEEAADKLLAGDIDAMAMLASWDAPVVQQLITGPALEGLQARSAMLARFSFAAGGPMPNPLSGC